jgi:hypothetical protein
MEKRSEFYECVLGCGMQSGNRTKRAHEVNTDL